jgi:hypothetical protein
MPPPCGGITVPNSSRRDKKVETRHDGLYRFLAFEFALGAVTRYWPGDTIFSSAYSAKFVDWGYPSWMRLWSVPFKA